MQSMINLAMSFGRLLSGPDCFANHGTQELLKTTMRTWTWIIDIFDTRLFELNFPVDLCADKGVRNIGGNDQLRFEPNTASIHPG